MKCLLESTQNQIILLVAGIALAAAGGGMALLRRKTAGKMTMRLFGFMTGVGVALALFGGVRLMFG